MENDQRFKSERIFFAELRYYEEHRCIEVSDALSYGLLYDTGKGYVNLLNQFEEFPVFKRVPYPNFTQDGEEFGSKVVCVSDTCSTGPCWVISKRRLSDEIEAEYVTLEDVEKYVLDQNEYFKDRESIIKEKLKCGRGTLKMVCSMLDDRKKKTYMQTFFKERIKGFEKLK